MPGKNGSRNHGFSLIELVIVVVIIGIIGAIAIPRMSRGAAGASDSALVANLSVLRNALDLYAVEHNNTYPALATISDQLTKRTKADGSVDDGSGAAGGYIYGPYIRSIPPLPVGAEQGNNTFTGSSGTADAGWVYVASTGEVTANSSESDAAGKAYASY